jgi:RNA polymerase sigma-70 factor (ECF subfamily)
MKTFLVDENLHKELEEEDLIRLSQGNLSQFGPLFDRYFDRVFKYVFSRTNNRQVAEDLASQIFLKILEALPRYQNQYSFAAWVFKIARNTLFSHYRFHLHHPIQSLDEAGLLESNPQGGLRDTPKDIDSMIDLEKILNHLPLKDQELLCLRFAASLSFSEIGEIQGKNPGAVKMAIHRILRSIEERMERTK